MTGRATWWRGGSIVARMTAWYAGSSLVLILAATGFLYWVLAANFEVEDTRSLGNMVVDLRLVLRAARDLPFASADAADPGQPPRQFEAIWLRIVDARGRTLLETPGMDAELPAAIFPAPLPVAALQEAAGNAVARSGKSYKVLSARVSTDLAHPDGRVLQVAMDRNEEELLLARYREQLWLVLAASLVLCSGIGYAIARSGMRPVERIAAAARKVRSSTLDQRIAADGLPAELRLLAGTFNEMLDRLEESFAQVSQFSADVAHELRTPVNNLRGEIEVALGKARTAEDYRETLGSALEECLRISRVIQSLLFLARAESATGSPHAEVIRVRQEIEAVLEFYEPAAAEAGVTLMADGAEATSASFDRTLFQQAVGNLVANALAHTPPGGRVTVRSSNEGTALRVEIADTGCGIAAEHLPSVFNRFYRVDRSRSGLSGNAGLGLAVVRSIAALHGGHVAIESEVGRGTRVVIRTPAGSRDAA